MIDERDVEAKFCRKVKAIGGWPLKFVSPGTSGVPDRLVPFLTEGHASRKSRSPARRCVRYRSESRRKSNDWDSRCG